MNVKYYTYKVEFQGRGHIHGTLWLNLEKIENLVEEPNGTMRQRTKEEKKKKKKKKVPSHYQEHLKSSGTMRHRMMMKYLL